MWHTAPDQHLPELGRVVEGTPDDLARVIHRLIAKDQSVRYRVPRKPFKTCASREDQRRRQRNGLPHNRRLPTDEGRGDLRLPSLWSLR